MKYKPTAGFAFIKPEQRYEDKTGLIEIPIKYRKVKKAVARVEQWTPEYRFACKRCGHVQHYRGPCRNCQSGDKMRMISKHPTDPFGGMDITGMRVIYVEAMVCTINDEIHRLPIDCIIAVLGDDVVLDQAEDNAPKRCRFCGPARSGTSNGMVLIPKRGALVCPRCHRSEAGELVV
jgi:hypothetical protein